jgi:hypothetical protein
MSVGGKVIDHKIFGESVYINTDDGGEKCAIYTVRNAISERISVGDTLWWQMDEAYWTAKDGSSKEDTKIKRIGYSGVPYPHNRATSLPKFN